VIDVDRPLSNHASVAVVAQSAPLDEVEKHTSYLVMPVISVTVDQFADNVLGLVVHVTSAAVPSFTAAGAAGGKVLMT
jgi:hypothetical protein